MFILFEFLRANIEIFTYVFLAVLSLFGLFIKTFIQEKAKMKVLESANKRLEELKKDHQLEITKRKHQYESKMTQYMNFFQLLDQFMRDNTLKMQERFLPIIEEFNKNYMDAASQNNRKKEAMATTTMSKKIQKIVFEGNQDLMRIRQETNTIKIIASDAILEKLELMEMAYTQLMNESDKMLSNLPKNMLSNNQVQMKTDQTNLELKSKAIESLKNQIIKLMRQELNEI